MKNELMERLLAMAERMIQAVEEEDRDDWKQVAEDMEALTRMVRLEISEREGEQSAFSKRRLFRKFWWN